MRRHRFSVNATDSMFCESVVVSTVVMEWYAGELTPKWCMQAGWEKKKKEKKDCLSFGAEL